MNEIAIKRHNFDLAKNRLKEFSQKTEAELEINKVRTDGGFLGLGDHKVTGYELNSRLETIQEHLIAVNTTNNKVIKEFREVYNALNALDKDYITSIVANVKAIEKTSNDVRVQQGTLKQHNEKLANQQGKLDAHQTEIEKNVANISKVVTALKNFKEKLDKYEHLTDIDKIWSDCKTIRNDIQIVSDSISKLSKKTTADIVAANNQNKALSDLVNKDIIKLREEAESFRKYFSDLSKKIEDTTELLDKQITIISNLSNDIESIKSIQHLNDVDTMWADLYEIDVKLQEIIQKHQSELDSLFAESAEHKESIFELELFRSKIEGIKHIFDLDSMWEQGNSIKDDLAESKAKFSADTEKLFNGVLDINKNIQEQQNSIFSLSNECAEHKENIGVLKGYLANANETIAALQQKTVDIDKNIVAANNQNKALLDLVNKDIIKLREEAESFRKYFSDLSKKIEDTTELLDKQITIISNLSNDIESIKSIQHLNDVDTMWADLYEIDVKLQEIIQKHQSELDSLFAESAEHKESIFELELFRSKIEGIKHIFDLDSMWEQGNSIKDDLAESKAKFSADTEKLFNGVLDINKNIQEQQNSISSISNECTEHKENIGVLKEDLANVNETIAALQQKTVDTDKKIEDGNNNVDISLANLEKKLKYAYLIAGGSLSLAVVELILLLAGVI